MASEAQTSKIDDQTHATKALSQRTIALRAHSVIGSNTPDSLIDCANSAFEAARRAGWAFEDTQFFVAKQTGTDTIDRFMVT